MARPTILIGIGSGGLRSIEYAWKLMQEIPADATAENRPLVHYIYLETDEQNKPCSEEIKSAPLTLSNSQTTTHALQQDVNCTTNWISGQDIPTNALSGAGGNPVFGRICIWDIANKKYFNAILQNALTAIVRQSIEKPLVFVTGSFGGGTGAGVFLDIAYIIRETLANEVELHGLFLLPNIGEADDVIYCNSLGALKALDFYSSEEHEYPFKWGPIPPRGYEKENSPYDLVQIISSEYNNTLGKISYNELQEDAGLFLFLNALGLYDTRKKSLVDATGNIIITKYTTFGLSALRYPQTQIKEILALDLSIDLLRRWVDTEFYYDKYNVQQQVQKESVDIHNKVIYDFENRFRKILGTWSTSVEVIADGQSINIEEDLHVLAKELCSGNYSYDEKRKKVYSYFRTGGRYYDVLKAKAATGALDPIVQYVNDKIAETLSQYENLKLAEVTLDAIYKSVVQIVNYWETLGITNDSNKWQKNIQELIPELIQDVPLSFVLLHEREKVYFDRLKFELLEGLAIHIFSDSMIKIKTAIAGKLDTAGNPTIVKDSLGRTELPSTKLLENIRNCITNTIQDDAAKFSCTPNRQSLYDKLQNNRSKTLFYVYPEGDLQCTLNVANTNYRATHPGQQSIRDITGNDDLWNFLKFNTSSTITFYHSIVDKYLNDIEMTPYTVTEAVSDPRNTNHIKNTATKGTIPHLPVNPTTRKAQFQNHDKIPHVMLGYAGAMGNLLGTIDAELIKMGIVDFSISNPERHSLSHIGLNNWLVFYKEFGYMSDKEPFLPTSDLRDFDGFCSIYMGTSSRSGDPQKFHGKRIPYISYSDCLAESTAYINKAKKYEEDLEYETAIKYYKIAKYWDISNNFPVLKIAELNKKIADENQNATVAHQRYLDIAMKYLNNKDYDAAEYYYNAANNKQPGTPFVQSQLQAVMNVKTKIYEIINQADNMCSEAHSLYNQWTKPEHRANIQLQTECLGKYQAIIAKYQDALDLSPNNSEIKKKKANINNYISRLTH